MIVLFQRFALYRETKAAPTVESETSIFNLFGCWWKRLRHIQSYFVIFRLVETLLHFIKKKTLELIFVRCRVQNPPFWWLEHLRRFKLLSKSMRRYEWHLKIANNKMSTIYLTQECCCCCCSCYCCSKTSSNLSILGRLRCCNAAICSVLRMLRPIDSVSLQVISINSMFILATVMLYHMDLPELKSSAKLKIYRRGKATAAAVAGSERKKDKFNNNSCYFIRPSKPHIIWICIALWSGCKSIHNTYPTWWSPGWVHLLREFVACDWCVKIPLWFRQFGMHRMPRGHDAHPSHRELFKSRCQR